MEINTVIHGFRIENARLSDELKGTVYEMRHIKTGARLVYLDNKENNKLFSAAFKTLPWDDTGVFHILEHSVLAGSENYPVKEPFLDLLKSSMNTFLNAMTFPDKTMYPVSSRNEQDFINLMRVYLDAVFKPAIYKNESIFRQEGWHYEPEENGFFYNGVVFNEMKGALGSVDGLIEELTKRYLFPDNTYRFESGGDPKHIPDLTYESFLRAHSEFYSPSNALLYLDGDVPLERVLEIIDGEYLSGFEFADKPHEIEPQNPIEAADITSYYEIGKEENEENKTQLVYARVFSDWSDRKRIMAYNLVASYLAGSNEAPLKRAILESRLAQDVEFAVTDGIAQPYYTLIFRNTDPDKKEEINRVYKQTIAKIIKEGIDRDELSACLNQFEFSLRETEEPQGLTRNINMLSSWLYGGDVMLYLENDKLLSELRQAIDSDFYNDILRELAGFDHTLTLTMLPSKTKGDEDAAEERRRLNSEYAAMSDAEKQNALNVYNKMREWQDTPDSPEAIATLPVLSLSDVSKKPMWLETERPTSGSVPVMLHKLDTNGIIHCNLFFDISDVTDDEIAPLSMLTNLYTLLPTSKHTPQELQKEIKKTIGSLDFNISSIPVKENPLAAKLYFTVNISVLEHNSDRALELVKEILTETDFSRSDIIRENMLQANEALYQGMLSAGHAFAIRRSLSKTSAAAYADEKSSGYDFLQYIGGFNADFDGKIDGFTEFLTKKTREIFVSERLTAGITAGSSPAVPDFSGMFPCGSGTSAEFAAHKQKPQKEIILIPSGVSYAVRGLNITGSGHRFEGKLSVASALLTYGYLWNEIRVHGGAYGCGFRANRNGNAVFYSYRDPNPLNSVEVYAKTSGFIKEYCGSNENIEKYIISSVAATEGLASTAARGFEADVNCLSGVTYADKLKIRSEMLNMTKDDLLQSCDMFDAISRDGSLCIVGNEDALSGCGDDFTVYRL